jgi:hypothetical protein
MRLQVFILSRGYKEVDHIIHVIMMTSRTPDVIAGLTTDWDSIDNSRSWAY